MVLCCGARKDKTVVHFSPDPVELPTKISNVDATSLKELVKTRCPSLFTPFETKWWLNRCVSTPLITSFATNIT